MCPFYAFSKDSIFRPESGIISADKRVDKTEDSKVDNCISNGMQTFVAFLMKSIEIE